MFFDSYLSSAASQNARALEQWGPVTMFVVIMLISIAGLMAVFFSKRFLFVIIALLVGIMFIFLLVSAVSGGVVSILLSDYCVGGVNNLTELAIDVMINDTCTKDAFRYNLFCYWRNQSLCDPFDKFQDQIEYNILNLTEAANDDPNNTQVSMWKETVRTLRSLSFGVNTLGDCITTNNLYLRTTDLFCGTATPSVIMFSSTIQLMVGLIFIFLLVVIRYNPSASGMVQDDIDIEMEKKERRRAGLRPPKDLKKQAPTKPPKACTMQCLGSFIGLLVIWGVLVLVMFIIMSVGSQVEYVPRVIYPDASTPAYETTSS